jgi:hypothetical protein
LAFKRGAKAAQEAAENNGPQGFEKIQYIKLSPGESVRMRLLHDGDEWYYASNHSFVPLRDPSPDWSAERKKFYTEKNMSATCRRDENIGESECYICDVMHTVKPNPKTKNAKNAKNKGKYWPQVRYFIPVVLREPIVGTQKMIDAGEIPAEIRRGGKMISTIDQVVGWTDKTESVDEIGADGEPTGSKVVGPAVRLVEASYGNSIANLQNLWEMSDEGTLLDRDVVMTRDGEEMDTKYLWVDKERTPAHDLTDPELRERYTIPDIEKLITERASEEYYAKFFDHRAPFFDYDDAEDSGGKDGGKTAEPESVEDALTEEQRAELAETKARLMAGLQR